MKLKFVKMGINGEGIAYLDHKPVFCDGVFPNEEAEVEIVQDRKTYYIAELKKITWFSKERFKTDYKYYIEEGCPLFPMRYYAQLKYKKQLLEEALYKYGNVKRHFVRDMKPSDITIGYRSACKLPVQLSRNHIMTGMYVPGTNHWHPIDKSMIQDSELEEARIKILKCVDHSHLHEYDKNSQKGLRYLVMRIVDHKIQCTLVTGKDKVHKELIEDIMKIPNMDGLFQSINTDKKSVQIFGSEVHKLAGNDTQVIDLDGIKLHLSPQSFFQLNIEQAKKMYEMAVSKIDDCDVLVEAYCGIGAMSLMAHKKANQIIGIESIKDAVDNANFNAKANNIENAMFMCCDAADGIEKVSSMMQIDTLLIDPPRSGMDDKMIQNILKAKPKKIIYISCNPSTLARNLKELKHQYHVVTIQPYDLFPHTPHVEALTVLEIDNY